MKDVTAKRQHSPDLRWALVEEVVTLVLKSGNSHPLTPDRAPCVDQALCYELQREPCRAEEPPPLQSWNVLPAVGVRSLKVGRVMPGCPAPLTPAQCLAPNRCSMTIPRKMTSENQDPSKVGLHHQRSLVSTCGRTALCLHGGQRLAS